MMMDARMGVGNNKFFDDLSGSSDSLSFDDEHFRMRKMVKPKKGQKSKPNKKAVDNYNQEKSEYTNSLYESDQNLFRYHNDNQH